MINEDGSAKGLCTILRERGINTVTMKADDMRTVLSYHEDFVTEDTIVVLEGSGVYTKFFRTEPYRACVAQVKVYCHAYTNFTL